MLRIGDTTTEVVFFGDDYRDVEPTYRQGRRACRWSPGVSRWTEVDTYLGTMLSVMDGFVLIWMIVIFLALSFGLVNTLVMAVFERVREIGLMLALGMKPSNILGQIIIESMMLLAVGLLIGDLLAWATIQPLRGGIDISVVAEGHGDVGRVQHACTRGSYIERHDSRERRRVGLWFSREPVPGLARVAL